MHVTPITTRKGERAQASDHSRFVSRQKFMVDRTCRDVENRTTICPYV